MNQARALYHLQTIDLNIGSGQARLAEIEAILGQNPAVVAAEQSLQQAYEALAPWKTRVRDLELEIKSLGSKSTAVEQRLYSGSVSNPKELQDMQEEIASLKRRRSKLEDDLLEAMIEVETAQANVDHASTDLEETRAVWETEQSDLLQERNDLRNSLETQREQRINAIQDITEETLAVYRKLHKSKRGIVVSPLVNNSCKFCGVGQTTTFVQQVRQGHNLVYCDNCGRILVLI